MNAAMLPKLGDSLEFLRVLWAVDHAMQCCSRRMEATLGITSPQRLVLHIVGRFPGLPTGHLAALLHVHPGTLTGILKRLERQALVRRRSDPRDRRRSLLSLTDKGRLLDLETEGIVESAVQRTLERARPESIRAARDVLESLVTLLSDESGAATRRGRSRSSAA